MGWGLKGFHFLTYIWPSDSSNHVSIADKNPLEWIGQSDLLHIACAL
jgi:hypothetical protein